MILSDRQQLISSDNTKCILVGRFDSVESANRAAYEVKSILRLIEEWYEAYPARHETARNIKAEQGTLPVSKPERRLARKYGVEWEQGIDWALLQCKAHHQLLFVYYNEATCLSIDPLSKVVERLTPEVTMYQY